jgi:hypothetical protein
MAAHRYWRLRIHSTHSNDNWTSVATLMGWQAGAIGDQLQQPASVCSASSTFGGFPATNANDGNDATAWITNTSGGVFTDPTDLKFDFGATAGNWRDIRQISFTSRTDGFWLQFPKNIEWQWSDDDITYTTTIGPLNTPAPTGPGQFYTSPSVGPASLMRLGEAAVLSAATVSTLALRTSMADVLTAINFPSPFVRTDQLQGLVTVKFANALRVSNAEVLVAVRGRTSNPKLRAWTFTLDGHDFYVLRLGTFATLVYDVYSEEWMDWDAYGEKYWPVNVGFNWVDGQGALGDDGIPFGSNVLVGDDTYPLLYFLDPNQPYDENPEVLDPQNEIFFERVLQGQVIQTGRQVQPCYAVWLTTDMGAPAYVGAGVKLEISDDAGKTYDDMGTIEVTVDENTPELSWYSLGQIAAPGRLFRLTDDGAVARIDSFEMNDPDDEKK